jgi:hypothetical protein
MLTIREFLKLACIGTLAGVLAACSSKPLNVQVEPTVTKTFTPIPANTLEPTATKEPTPTAAEAPKFTKENISIIPNELGDIPKLVEVADPINNQAQFKADMAKIWGVIQKDILPTYTGQYFEFGGRTADDKTVEVMPYFDSGSLSIRQDMSLVGAFQYEVNGVPSVGFIVPAQDNEKQFPLIILTDPIRENYINANGDCRRDNLSLLGLIQDGVIKFNPLNYTELFYTFPNNPNSDWQTIFDKKVLSLYSDGTQLLNYMNRTNPKTKDVYDGNILITTWFQSQAKK